MRITATLDDDVAAALKQRREDTHASMKQIVNEALRFVLLRKSSPFRTKTFQCGPMLINVDNVAEALALAEGEDHR